MCLGSPGKQYNLIIDTGSSITAVPCSGCQQCGVHHCGRTGYFDTSTSPSSRTISCREPPPGFTCERCSAGNRCAYSVRYTEGSSIRGHVVTDIAHFTRSVDGAEDAKVPMRVYFGCQTHESGMFYRQQADGIMGMQPPRAQLRVPSVLTSLAAEQRSQGARDTFSLCLSDRSGLFLLGGTPDLPRLRANSALVLPMDRHARARYKLALREVLVSGSRQQNATFRSLRLPVSTYSPTIVDSGTTFVYASTPLYRSLHAHLKAEVPALTREGRKVCAFLTAAQLGSMPSLQFVFNVGRFGVGRPLLVRPSQYMVEFPGRSTDPSVLVGARHYCAAIFDNQDGGTVIGASIMREREVIFDISESTITFVDADCNRITPATSYMRGAFSFDTCPAKNDSTSMSGAHPAPSTPVAPSSPGPYSVGSRWPLGAPAAASGAPSSNDGTHDSSGTSDASRPRGRRHGRRARWTRGHRHRGTRRGGQQRAD